MKRVPVGVIKNQWTNASLLGDVGQKGKGRFELCCRHTAIAADVNAAFCLKTGVCIRAAQSRSKAIPTENKAPACGIFAGIVRRIRDCRWSSVHCISSTRASHNPAESAWYEFCRRERKRKGFDLPTAHSNQVPTHVTHFSAQESLQHRLFSANSVAGRTEYERVYPTAGCYLRPNLPVGRPRCARRRSGLNVHSQVFQYFDCLLIRQFQHDHEADQRAQQCQPLPAAPTRPNRIAARPETGLRPTIRRPVRRKTPRLEADSAFCAPSASRTARRA